MRFGGGVLVACGLISVAQAQEFSPINLSGLYLGANVGRAWNTNRSDLEISNNFGASVSTRNLDTSGGFSGLQTGYNWQFGAYLLGVEADIQAAAMQDSFHRQVGANDVVASSTTDYFGTVRGRAGYVIDNLLVYGTAGFAYGGVQDNVLVNSVANPTRTATAAGYAAGAGLEFMMARNTMLKAEYMHLNLGGTGLSAPVMPPNGVTIFTSPIRHDYDIIRIGFNVRFASDEYRTYPAPLK